MNKILIVGHPASGLQDVEALLHQCGMRGAHPSRREGLQPQDVTATLCKAYKVPPAETVVAEEDFQQIAAGPVWHGMALDLMLGNLDQALWGWADPQAIYALDYWNELDPKLTFVLVYDEPHRVLMEAARADGQPPTAPAVQQMLDNWTAYNGALLRFFLRHPGRCLLVHSQQVRRAVDAYLQQLQPLLDTPLVLADASAPAALRSLPQDVAGVDVAAHGVADAPSSVPATTLPAGLAQAVIAVGLEPQEAARLMDTGAAERYLVDGVLAGQPSVQQLYAELQSSANLPLGGPAGRQGDPAAAWEKLVRQRAFVSGLVAQLTAQAAAGEQLAQAHVQENELLLSQLHQVQEELERHCLHKQELEHRCGELERETQRQAAEARTTLEAEKAAAVHDKKLKELGEENELLLTQLHQVQEELERYYLDNQRLKQKLSPPKPPAPYGAVQRIKRQLSYRLGATMIDRSRSVGGWLGMPWALIDEIRDFRKKRAARPAEKLPPLHLYRDAHEAERVKQHLSYRLGNTLLKHGKSPVGWLKLPFALRREVRQFRQQRKVA